ncbi:putative metacaspase-1 [Blattamonas nauphoetae]|uniref:Metacaspase-1 n=1 Tax=Blattamonas nauphoetae TaxID=2049346 RepID=A0ABQ9X4X6_9EUKA|nr:putative metacaspase-1 [Blattamonas nauphoetae]
MSRIKVSLISGNSLMSARVAPVCDPFVVLKLGTTKYISTTKRGVNVKWNEGFIFNLGSYQPILRVECFDKDRIKIGKADNIGSTEIDLSPYLHSLPQTVTAQLKWGTLTLTISDPDSSAHFGNTQLPSQAMQTQARPPQQSTQATTSKPASAAQKPSPSTQPANKPPTPQADSFGYADGDVTTAEQPSQPQWGIHQGKRPPPPFRKGGKRKGKRPPRPHKLTHEQWLKLQNIDLSQTVQLHGSIFAAPPTEVDPEDAPPPVNIQTEQITKAEQDEIQKRWAKFVAYMAKPFNYDSKYKKQLQQLDAMGALNLERVKRDHIPPITINYCCALFFCPYEDLPHTLDLGPVNDAITMAELFISRGFTVVYVCDATPKEYYIWMNWLLENVEKEFVSYFSGHGTQIKDTTGKEADGLSEVMVFYNEKTKFKNTGKSNDKIQAVQGITDETVEDTVMFDLIAGKDYNDTRIVLLSDCCHSGTMFNMDQVPEGGHLMTPPFNVVCVGSAQDSQTAKQTVLGGKESGVFTYNFCQLLKQKPLSTFLDLKSYMGSQIKKYQTIQLTGSSAALYREPILPNVPAGDRIKFAHEVTAQDTGGIPPTAIVEAPKADEQSEIEKQEAKKRWDAFQAEMKKPANYNSKYKKQLQELDAMGAINLERLTKEQIPTSFRINYSAGLFFCPYEDLPHTLDLGPVNDAIEYAKLFIERGYTVCYLCDATPLEYYKWVDWLLENTEKEFISIFSGHGTQIPDTTGREADGLSEVMVFYNSKKKKRATGTAVPKIDPVSGITEETVEDTVMFDLISSKDYPEMRSVFLTDCCHSGSMFNMEYTIGEDGEPITPPYNVICVGSAQDNQTAKQTMLGGKEIGVFTYNFTKLIREKPKTTFNDLKTYMDKTIKKYQTIVLSASAEALYDDPILMD